MKLAVGGLNNPNRDWHQHDGAITADHTSSMGSVLSQHSPGIVTTVSSLIRKRTLGHFQRRQKQEAADGYGDDPLPEHKAGNIHWHPDGP
jgi:hypothetical protein